MKETFKNSDGSEIVVTEKDYEGIKNLTDEEIEEMARADSEHPPMSDEESKRLKRVNPLPLRSGTKHG